MKNEERRIENEAFIHDAGLPVRPKHDRPGHLRELFPGASDELLGLFEAAEDHGAVFHCDLHTVRDWLQIANYDDESLHALLLLMILAEQEGSLCIEISEASLSRRLGDLVSAPEAQGWAQRLVKDLTSRDFGNLIGTAPNDHRPVIAHVVAGCRYLYFQKFLRHELEFAKAFRARLASAPLPDSFDLGAVLHAVCDEQPLRQGGLPVVLDKDQRRAVELAMSRPLVVISGGPGTGKTSIVFTLLRCLARCGVTPERIALAAPTGRAAQRLADAVRAGLAGLAAEAEPPDGRLAEVRAVTVHQLLDYVPSGDYFRRHAENPIDADVVIVDEASMVGMILMARLFAALPPRARLILLGDKDQLPSVDAGAVLAHLIPDAPSSLAMGVSERANGAARDALVTLETNHRSLPQIRAIASAINQQQAELCEALPLLTIPRDSETWGRLADATGVLFLEQQKQTPAELRQILQHWASFAYVASGFQESLARFALSLDLDEPRQLQTLGKLFYLLERTRLLTLVREGPWGCEEINRWLSHFLRPRLDPHAVGALFHGAQVLITRNDVGRGLFNGDVGLALRSADGSLRVVFARRDSFLCYPAEALPPYELGFALTVHKSQGSEYGRVLLVFPPTGGRRLLTKELVYTGVTRAKELAILCATRELLQAAIQRKCQRESGLLRLIQGA